MASKRRLRRKRLQSYEKSYAGKVKHNSKENCFAAMRHMKKLNSGIVPYHCPFCQHWHLGNS